MKCLPDEKDFELFLIACKLLVFDGNNWNHIIQIKTVVEVTWCQTFSDITFLMQVSLGNEKSFGKQVKAWINQT